MHTSTVYKESLMSILSSILGQRILNLRILSPLQRMQLMLRIPSLSRLSLRLLRDERVPIQIKAAAVGAVALIVSPIDLPGWVPVIGQAADVFVIVNVLDVFIKAAPREVVREHIHDLGLENKFSI